MHPFRFGVMLESVRDADSLFAALDRAEIDGYSTVLIRDHLVAEPFGPQLAPFTTLAMAAAHSSTLRLGTMVIDNDFRHPAVLAKEIATLDVLSGGRVELGIGAGWLAAEYQQAGIPFDSPGTRIARLEESLTLLKDLLSGKPATFHGRALSARRTLQLPAFDSTTPSPLLSRWRRSQNAVAGRARSRHRRHPDQLDDVR